MSTSTQRNTSSLYFTSSAPTVSPYRMVEIYHGCGLPSKASAMAKNAGLGSLLESNGSTEPVGIHE